MTVKQALKLKSKLVTEIKELYEIAKTQNSIETGNPRRYSITDVLDEAEKKTAQLVEIKTRIHIANSQVYPQIFMMSELKGRVKQLKAMSVEEGKVTSRYGMQSETKEVEINIAQRNEMVKDLESVIERLQDELDTHNATTNI